MNEDPTPFFIMGMMLGVIATLLIQAYGRRKVRLATKSNDTVDTARSVTLLANENEQQSQMILRLEERIAVMERIATDPAERTARAIEALR
jgi:hypothetical protein